MAVNVPQKHPLTLPLTTSLFRDKMASEEALGEPTPRLLGLGFESGDHFRTNHSERAAMPNIPQNTTVRKQKTPPVSSHPEYTNL